MRVDFDRRRITPLAVALVHVAGRVGHRDSNFQGFNEKSRSGRRGDRRLGGIGNQRVAAAPELSERPV